jgi:hypothetical protein
MPISQLKLDAGNKAREIISLPIWRHSVGSDLPTANAWITGSTLPKWDFANYRSGGEARIHNGPNTLRIVPVAPFALVNIFIGAWGIRFGNSP